MPGEKLVNHNIFNPTKYPVLKFVETTSHDCEYELNIKLSIVTWTLITLQRQINSSPSITVDISEIWERNRKTAVHRTGTNRIGKASLEIYKVIYFTQSEFIKLWFYLDIYCYFVRPREKAIYLKVWLLFLTLSHVLLKIQPVCTDVACLLSTFVHWGVYFNTNLPTVFI